MTYSTMDGTAVAGSDFVGVSHGQVTIAAGSTSATVLIDVLADNLPELMESFTSPARFGRGHRPVARSFPLPAARPAAPSRRSAPTVVASTDMAALGSTDPAGIAYVPGMGFFVSDSEVEESPFFRTTNLWKLQPDGTLVAVVQPLELHR